MNMISTAFPIEIDASSKQKDLLKKLTSVWEKKNSKIAKAGGMSLMALSLAACGAEDDTPFSQEDVTAAETAATSAANAVAATAAAEAAAAAIVAQTEAVAAAEFVAGIAAQDAAAAAVVATAEAVAAAEFVANAVSAAAAEAAATAAATAATAAATAATAAQVTAVAAATAAAEAVAATAAATLKITTDAALASSVALYDALVAPRALTFAATTAETLTGGEGNDTFTGSGSSFTNIDKIRDTSSIDADVANLTATAATTPVISGVETVNLTLNAVGAATVTASSMSGVNVLTLTRGDVVIGGSTISGNKTHVVAALDAADVAKVAIAGVATTVGLTQTLTAGAILDADVATGNITVVGAGTINAAGAGTGDTVLVTAIDGDTGAETATAAANNAKAVVINTGAENVTLANDGNGGADAFTGALSITGAASKNITIAAAAGGATVNVLGEKGVLGTDGVTIVGIDGSGASVTTSYVGNNTGGVDNKGAISLSGSGTTDVATVSAAGITKLVTNAANEIETINLSGNGAAVTYELTGAPTTFNVTGDQNVTISGTAAQFGGKTLTDNNSGTTTVDINSTLVNADLSGVAADNFIISTNAASKTLTVASDATVTLAKDPTTALAVAGKAANATVNLATADDTTASGATIDIQTTTLTASANVKTLNIDATVGKLTVTNTTGAVTTDVTIAGTKDVNLGNTTAKSVTSTSTGKISLDAANASLVTVTTGGGADTIVMDVAAVVTVVTGGGIDTVTAAASASSSYITGDGADVINLNNANSVVINAGAGNDNIKIADDIDSDATIVGGDGTDTLTFLEDGAGSTTAKANFVMSSIEVIDVTAGGVTISAAQFASNNTFQLNGNAIASDFLNITNAGSTGTGIDASNVTYQATQGATLNLTGLASVSDTITGSTKVDTITSTTGGDKIDGNLGVDTFITSNLVANNIELGTSDSNAVVINMGNTAVTNTAILSATDSFTAAAVTSVGAGEYAYTFAANLAANSAIKGTIVNVENITGSGGKDYIIGSAAANTLLGAAEADYLAGGFGADNITGGAGADTIVLDLTDAASDIITYSAVTDGGLAAKTITNTTSTADDFTVTAGMTPTDNTVEFINDFVSGSDKINISGALKTLLNSTNDAGNGNDNVAVIIDNGTNTVLNMDLGTVYIATTAKLGGDDFGDASVVIAGQKANDGTASNGTDNQQYILAIENNSGTQWGMYLIKDTDHSDHGVISTTDVVTLMAVIDSATLVAGDFTFV